MSSIFDFVAVGGGSAGTVIASRFIRRSWSGRTDPFHSCGFNKDLGGNYTSGRVYTFTAKAPIITGICSRFGFEKFLRLL